MSEMLWPARNVAEYAYCPRLFYYMEVEGIHAPSEDTLEGVRVHRRVDAPSAEPDDQADGERPRCIRSLTLTDDQLGLTATLDLTDISGSMAVPVEYRKGRPRRTNYSQEGDDQSSVEPWPTDRVQVGLQAILLERAGYTVPEATLYYAAEKRRVTVPVDDALRADALATLEAAKACATGPRPLPLVNDARCPRCSLQPICLPDEVNQQRAAETGEVRPRKIWPPRDDGIHVVAQQDGTKIGVRGSAMV
ncbi:MAG: CRISPR-associated protein Cas4, partial [Pirellulales bacterium]